MCTPVRITFIGLLFLGLGTSSDAESGSNHRNETTKLQYELVDNDVILFHEYRNGSNILALPVGSVEPKDVIFLYNNLSTFINNDTDVVFKESDLKVEFDGYHVMNSSITIPFSILVTEKQAITILERIMLEFAKDESIINQLYNYTIYPDIVLQVVLMPDLIIPGCENITLKYLNLVRKFYNFETYYTKVEIVAGTVIILGSLLICGCILKYKRLQTPPNVYVFSLAVSVILQVALLLTGLVLTTLQMKRIWFITRLIIFSSWTAGIYTAVGITVDRYITICHPSLRYRISTNRTAFQINVAIWALSLIVTLIEDLSGLLAQVSKYFIVYSLILYNVLPLCIILLSHVCIARRLWTSSKMKQPCSDDEQPPTDKSMKIAAVIAIEYILCWVPCGGYNFLNMVIKPFQYGMFYKFIALQIFLLGSLLNPLLYALVSKDFRYAYKNIIPLCIGCIRRRLCSGESPRYRESSAALNAVDGESNISLNET